MSELRAESLEDNLKTMDWNPWDACALYGMKLYGSMLRERNILFRKDNQMSTFTNLLILKYCTKWQKFYIRWAVRMGWNIPKKYVMVVGQCKRRTQDGQGPLAYEHGIQIAGIKYWYIDWYLTMQKNEKEALTELAKAMEAGNITGNKSPLTLNDTEFTTHTGL